MFKSIPGLSRPTCSSSSLGDRQSFPSQLQGFIKDAHGFDARHRSLLDAWSDVTPVALDIAKPSRPKMRALRRVSAKIKSVLMQSRLDGDRQEYPPVNIDASTILFAVTLTTCMTLSCFSPRRQGRLRLMACLAHRRTCILHLDCCLECL